MQTTCPPPNSAIENVTFELPADSCDSHCHVFGPVADFPYAENRSYTPPEAPVEQLRKLHSTLGFSRAVLTQPACHGTDHSALVHALSTSSGRYRGVALVDVNEDPAALVALHQAGVRGARLNFVPALAPVPDDQHISRLIDMISPLGWHLAVHLQGDGVLRYERLFASLGIPVVIDHMARVDLRDGLDSPSIHALRRLLSTGNVWVKLSGADRIAAAPPQLDDAVELAALLARENPDRVLWGTDYPHPNMHRFMPDDGTLVNTLTRVAPSKEALHSLLVANPARCFGFDEG